MESGDISPGPRLNMLCCQGIAKSGHSSTSNIRVHHQFNSPPTQTRVTRTTFDKLHQFLSLFPLSHFPLTSTRLRGCFSVIFDPSAGITDWGLDGAAVRSKRSRQRRRNAEDRCLLVWKSDQKFGQILRFEARTRVRIRTILAVAAT